LTQAYNQKERLLEACARRAAKFVGLCARKSRSAVIDNAGHFQLGNPYTGDVKAGHRFELTAEDVLEFARRWPEWGRLPKPKGRLEGLSRTSLVELIDSDLVKSLTLRQPGALRGIRLIYLPSLRKYLHDLANK
jgi:hypothetical protein